jgi:predicted transcriptional regulator
VLVSEIDSAHKAWEAARGRPELLTPIGLTLTAVMTHPNASLTEITSLVEGMSGANVASSLRALIEGGLISRTADGPTYYEVHPEAIVAHRDILRLFDAMNTLA